MAVPVRRQYQIFIDRPPQAVFDFFVQLRNYSRVLSADQQILNEAGTVLREGGKLRLKWKQGALWRTLECEITDWNPPQGFSEKQTSGPFASWVLRHRFTEFQTGTLMSDQIEYLVPGGPLGLLTEKLVLGTALDTLMNQRQQEAKRLLETVTRIKGRGV